MLKVRTLAVIASITTIIFVTSATMPEDNEPQYKNLKVLPKKISHDEMDKVMHHYNKALGVKCNFCHAKASDGSNKLDFASDEKPEKQSAREMMKMTNKINLKYFGGKKEVFNHAAMEVSCNTCHNGKSHPEEH
ncbi:c-type cytochrome [Desertivirga arenae]|uniref:c-type cytochrome n=1 Tax=Desertivirga arenae TaxID=2810309 RepID=UPI001A964821|nr:c-type cytochrome [Pedobacter sp. SYSU D00823]